MRCQGGFRTREAVSRPEDDGLDPGEAIETILQATALRPPENRTLGFRPAPIGIELSRARQVIARNIG